MSIKYRYYKNKNVKSTGYNKYYVKRTAGKVYTEKDLAVRLAARSSSFSRGEMLGIILDLGRLIQELCIEGNSCKISDLGIFSVGIISKGVANADDFNASTDIIPKWRLRATGETQKKFLGITRTTAGAGGVQLTFEEDDNYESPRRAAQDGD